MIISYIYINYLIKKIKNIKVMSKNLIYYYLYKI